MSRYQKRLTFSLPRTQGERLLQLKRETLPDMTQSELLRLVLRAGLEQARENAPAAKEEKPLL